MTSLIGTGIRLLWGNRSVQQVAGRVAALCQEAAWERCQPALAFTSRQARGYVRARTRLLVEVAVDEHLRQRASSLRHRRGQLLQEVQQRVQRETLSRLEAQRGLAARRQAA